MEQLDFPDLARREVPVTIGGVVYVLREADEAAHSSWRNFQISGTKVDDDGKILSMGALADSDAVLLSKCLFKDDVPVALEFVKGLPSRISRVLVDKAKKLSEIDKELTKKSLSGTELTSA